ncbi:hypothetical protein KKC83_05130 [Patescibacteria group bacterium]|nr:hypothetical protein [Candidatus Falkowbacteria bacterium]MBU3906296.1 hypothetical protein [Patescibacteria group bacterium]MCG2697921.1 hypothetical protein [Candidatus Parcubacteria bacterium]MBU4015331.1 hypothetical protein [Patescibacteria group bacterium]MBU4026901.1 hypothetical protein [Patescibacteria group bacterium]
MIKKKKIWLAAGVIAACFAIYMAIGVFDYLEYRNAAIASGSMPAQDGGRITMVREPCILDTPANVPTTCAVSCPLVTTAVGTLCTGYIEIDTTGQLGTTFIAAPTGFVYKGGGTHPTAGMDFLYGGASNALPWVIGIPSKAASRTQKLVGVFNFVMAGFRE